MTHLYITCENWESLKGIKEPQISAQDPQETPRKKETPKNPSKLPPTLKNQEETFFSPLVDNPV